MGKSINISVTDQPVRLHGNIQMSRDTRKPVFGIFNKVRFKPVSSATKTTFHIEILIEPSLDMILYNKRTD